MNSVISPTKKKGNPNTRSPLHVNLRTQQRRLRHVRSLSVRSLIPAQTAITHPLDIRLAFTLHRTDGGSNIAIYKSRYLQETYNPTWGSLLLDYNVLGVNSVLSCFILKVWQVNGSSDQEDNLLCFEKLIDLREYVYLGQMMVRLESKGYPPNSVIVGMPEGYYVHCDDGGYPSPRRPSFHRIMDYLPPQSLIEVRRSEVVDSYSIIELKKLVEKQTTLNKLRTTVLNDRKQLQAIGNKSATRIKQREESIELITRCELLRKQIKAQKSLLTQEKSQLTQVKTRLDKKEQDLWKKQCSYKESQMKYDKNKHSQSQKRDLLMKTARKMYLRQRVMIAELAETYCIREVNGNHSICGVFLPNGDPTENGGTGAGNAERVSVALGFVTHLVDLLARFLLVPLQYTLHYSGSRSFIIDNVHDEQNTDFKEFPLYLKGADKSMFQFGLYLLWRDIVQLRQHCGYGSARSAMRRTLPNLKSLLDKLVKDRYSVSPLSEMTPPSISITAPTMHNPSPRTSIYYLPTSDGQSLMSEDSTVMYANSLPHDPIDDRGSGIDTINDEGSEMNTRGSGNITANDKGLGTGTSPMMLRRSAQIRRHPDGFRVKEFSSSPQSGIHDDDDSLSQSPDGAIYSLDITCPLSNPLPPRDNTSGTPPSSGGSGTAGTNQPLLDGGLLPYTPSPSTNSPRLHRQSFSNDNAIPVINSLSIDTQHIIPSTDNRSVTNSEKRTTVSAAAQTTPRMESSAQV